MKPTFFVFLMIFVFMLQATRYMLYARAESVQIGATVDEHLSWWREGNDLIISTNKTEGFILYTNKERITKKGPIILTTSFPKTFILVSSF